MHPGPDNHPPGRPRVSTPPLEPVDARAPARPIHVRARVQRAGKAVPGLLSDLRGADIDLESIEVLRPTLDDVFLTLTGRSLRDAESTAATDPTSKEK